jgi:RimJ/RimL family protein N-acetyltransferase
MTFVPITEFTDKMWYESYLIVYNKEIAFHMGVNPQLIANPPTLTEFYDNISAAVEAGTGYGFGIIKDGDLIGHVILDKRSGEWEVGTVLKDKKYWNSGIGARATLHALKWIFDEQEAKWAITHTFGRDPKVRDMLIRGGFKPFMSFLILDQETWKERWSRRV